MIILVKKIFFVQFFCVSIAVISHASKVMLKILQARTLEWVAISFSKNTQKNCTKKIFKTKIIMMV